MHRTEPLKNRRELLTHVPNKDALVLEIQLVDAEFVESHDQLQTFHKRDDDDNKRTAPNNSQTHYTNCHSHCVISILTRQDHLLLGCSRFSVKKISVFQLTEPKPTKWRPRWRLVAGGAHQVSNPPSTVLIVVYHYR